MKIIKINKRYMTRAPLLAILILLISPLTSAGVGIKWDKETILIDEGAKECLSYGVYNPWPEEAYVTIELSEELGTFLTLQQTESKLIPSDTKSNDAIPIEFCFRVPNKVYKRSCWIGNVFVCKQECTEETKEYKGDVIVKSVPKPKEITGSGGSLTGMSVSAPLNLKINCNPKPRDYTLIYAILAAISIVVLVFLIRKSRNTLPEMPQN